MANLNHFDLVIDWGFSRFKLWLYDSNNSLVNHLSVYTSDVSASNIFYGQDDLARLRLIILSIVADIQSRFHLNIYSSSQMHCVGAYSTNFGLFLSTWNDSADHSIPANHHLELNGIPCLRSMPCFKLDSSNYIFSSNYTLSLGIEPNHISVSYLESPVNLLLSSILNIPLPCSNSWWQSTCLCPSLLDLSTSSGSYLSEDPLSLSTNNLSSISPYLVSLTVFPEVGDLQASTYASSSRHDLLINVGTGSQVIITNPDFTVNTPYFRFWPSSGHKYPVIAHIPCGRLLQDYVAHNKISFADIHHAFHSLDANSVRFNVARSSQSLLYFPGFCTHTGMYLDSPSLKLSDIVNLNLDTFLSLWIFQYCRVIELLMDSSFESSHICSIAVTGDLGGLSSTFVSLLQELMPPSFVVCSEDIDLPESLMSVFA